MPYLIFDKKPDNEGFVKVVNNRTILSEFLGISYDTLTDHFSRRGNVWHYYEDKGIIVIRFDNVEKGRQRIKRYDPHKYNRNK